MRKLTTLTTAVLVALSPQVIAIDNQTSEIAEDHHAASMERQLEAASGIHRDNMIILNERSLELANTQRKLTIYKVEDKISGEAKSIALDEWQSQVDLDTLIAEDAKVRFDRQGVMNDAVAKSVRAGGDIPVMLQLNVAERFVDKSQFENKAQRADLERSAKMAVEKTEQDARQLFAAVSSELALQTRGEISHNGPFVRTAQQFQSHCRPQEPILHITGVTRARA